MTAAAATAAGLMCCAVCFVVILLGEWQSISTVFHRGPGVSSAESPLPSRSLVHWHHVNTLMDQDGVPVQAVARLAPQQGGEGALVEAAPAPPRCELKMFTVGKPCFATKMVLGWAMRQGQPNARRTCVVAAYTTPEPLDEAGRIRNRHPYGRHEGSAVCVFVDIYLIAVRI